VKEIVFKSSVLAWIRIRIEQKCWIRICITSIRIHNPDQNKKKKHLIPESQFTVIHFTINQLGVCLFFSQRLTVNLSKPNVNILYIKHTTTLRKSEKYPIIIPHMRADP
jgi:hypothetical protein